MMFSVQIYNIKLMNSFGLIMNYAIICLFPLIFFFQIFTFPLPCIESRESTRVRSKRGKVTRASSIKIKGDVKQHLDATESDPMPLEIQTKFLSESVRKYLELGRAIPGLFAKRFPIVVRQECSKNLLMMFFFNAHFRSTWN